MTALQAVAPQTTRPTTTQASRTQQVVTALANSRDKLERPFRLIERLHELIPPRAYSPVPSAGARRAAVWAQAWLDDMGDLAEVETIHADLLRASQTPADMGSARITLGLLLSAYPNTGKEPKEEYFATLLHDVTDEGINPFVLAEACRKVRRSMKFIPTVSELISACGMERRRLDDGLANASRIIEARDKCREVVRIHAMPVTDWPEWVWANAICDRRSVRVGDVHPWDVSLLGPAPGQSGCQVPPSVLARFGLPVTT
ncbi:hypothetical protein ACO2Q1_00250 [Brevundimonas sp. VNH65]|uniref:hypothetical protein n=1 Tax=Brevundimonas sp. VNH65 TaxID=3400917 RepID=UPI003C05B900